MDKEYTALFNAITAAVDSLEKTRYYLLAAQVQAEEIYMGEDDRTKTILDRFRPYIQAHGFFDIVPTKFGLLYVHRVSDGETIETRLLEGFQDLTETLALQFIGDVWDQRTEKQAGQRTTPEEIQEARRRLVPYVTGLEFEADCLALIDRYLSALTGA